MNKRQQNIAILLLWIFTFPIVLQSVHIVLHRSHLPPHSHEHELYNDYKAVGNYQYEYQVSDKLIDDESCPICKYHFSTNNLLKTFFYKTLLPLIHGFVYELKINFISQKLFTLKSPRAPPYC